MIKNDQKQPIILKNTKKMIQNNSRRPKMKKTTQKSKVLPTDGRTDRPTDQPTDRPTDGAGCRVAYNVKRLSAFKTELLNMKTLSSKCSAGYTPIDLRSIKIGVNVHGTDHDSHS